MLAPRELGVRRVVRAVQITLMASAVGACVTSGSGPDASAPQAATAPPSAWKFDRKSDAISGGVSAFVIASRVTALAGRLPRPAALELMCFKSEPVIRLRYKQTVGSNRSASLRYRFDDKTGRDPSVRFLPDRQSVVIEDKADVSKFVGELDAATELIVSITSLSGGTTNAAFPVAGAPPAIATAFAQCPLPSGKQTAAAGR